jgi:hypothetical protein
MAMCSSKALIACLSLLLGACADQKSESEMAAALPFTAKLNSIAGEHIQKLHQAEQARADLKKRCDKMFNNLRIRMRVRNEDSMAQCAEISYTKTLHDNHEVWNWKDGGGRSVYFDKGILTTINGTLPSTPK